MIYTRYHKARAAKVAAERARITREDAEISGEAAVVELAPVEAAESAATKPPTQQPPQQRTDHKRRSNG